jgi:hypothetical protein
MGIDRKSGWEIPPTRAAIEEERLRMARLSALAEAKEQGALCASSLPPPEWEPPLSPPWNGLATELPPVAGVFPDPANPKDALGLKKTPLRLFPAAAMIRGAEVMALGAEKYGEFNWRDHPVRLTVYLEAAMRHILQMAEGENSDEESGQLHIAHAMMCMAILIDADWNNVLIDDRPARKRGVTYLMKGLTGSDAAPI